MSKEVVVLGAGVVGLTTALCLLRRLECKVTVLAKSFDQTWSHAAGAWFIPDPSTRESLFVMERYARWAKVTEEMLGGYKGCQRVSGVRLYMPGTLRPEGLEPFSKVMKLKVLDEAELPHGFQGQGVAFETWTIKMAEYLADLRAQLDRSGCRFVAGEVTSLEEVAKCYPSAVLVNCLGLGASEVASDPAMWAARGQTLLVRAPQARLFSLVTGDARPCYVLPQGDGTAVLGGCVLREPLDSALKGSAEDVEGLAQELLRDARAWCPELESCTPLRHTVGWRPFREGGARVELDPKRPQVVHNYGHGDVGVILSWGCAEEAAELVARMRSKL